MKLQITRQITTHAALTSVTLLVARCRISPKGLRLDLDARHLSVLKIGGDCLLTAVFGICAEFFYHKTDVAVDNLAFPDTAL